MRDAVILPLFLLSLWLAWPSLQGKTTDEDEKYNKYRIAHSIMRKVGQAFSTKHHMHMAGISEAVHKDDKKYTEIGLAFQVRRPIPKDEGRKLLLECAEELLDEINGRTDFRPFLHEYPFLVENIRIDFFVSDEVGGNVYDPEIGIFSLYKGKLRYFTDTPERKCSFFSEEEETYEEALQIVQEKE